MLCGNYEFVVHWELVKKYSEFISFPIYLWVSKEVDEEVPAYEDESGDDEETSETKSSEEEEEEDVEKDEEEKNPKPKTVKVEDNLICKMFKKLLNYRRNSWKNMVNVVRMEMLK